jgi:hypothetical protein
MPEAAEFDDISLEIRSLGKGRFETRLQAEGQVGAAEPFAMQVDAAKLKPFLTVFNAVPAGLAPDPRAIGSSLFEALFQGDVRRLFDRSRARADEAGTDGSARGVRLRIQLDLRDEQVRPLAALPWELLHDPLDRTFYGHGRERLLVRHLDSARPVEPLPLTHPLRILVVPSSPKDFPKLNLKKEVERLEAAFHWDPCVHVIVQKPATIEAVRQRLREETFHALHFLGHGGFVPETGLGRLYFETASRNSQPIDGDFFSDLVRDFPSLRLVVLNACRTAQVPGSEVPPYATLGTALSLAGVPAVVAMQFTVSDTGAIRFSETFYQSLAAGDPVDVAVAGARRELYESEHPSLEWAVPVLFLRSRDGRIFDLPREAEGAAPKAKAHPHHGNGDHPRKSAEAPKATKEPWGLGIRSREPLGERPETTLNLTRHFDGRLARHPDLWRTDILPELAAFLRPVLTGGRPILLDFAAHASLAFAAGYGLEAKSGLDITIRQRLQKGGFEDWTPSTGPLPDAPYWKAEDDRPRDAAAHDVAVAVGLTWPVLDDVEAYLDKSRLAVSRLLPATLAPEPSQSGVHGGAHALALAQALALRIRARTPHERHGTLHLFVSGPNAFLFYLGQLAHGLGRIQLYEYDFDSGAPGDYRPSIALPAGGK